MAVDSAPRTTREFVRWAPTSEGRAVPLVTQPLSSAIAKYWDSKIQPTIDGLPSRADRRWRWRRIAALGQIIGLPQGPAGFALSVESDGGETPCALVQLVGAFPALDEGGAESVFLWYLADAPVQALGKLLDPLRVPKMLGTLALDIAVTHSFRLSLSGRTALHADPAGGDRLARWYAARGMKNHPPVSRRLSLMRPNDGRYFYFTPEGALTASQALDRFRRLDA